MNILELTQLIDGTPLTTGGDNNHPVKGAFAADLMSDVLASIQPEAVLVTGLMQPAGDPHCSYGRCRCYRPGAWKNPS